MKSFCLFLLLAASSAQAGIYPMMSGSPSRHSRNLGASPLQGALKVKWSNLIPGLAGPSSHPIILEDRILVMSWNGLFCLNRSTGAQIWQRQVYAQAQPSYDTATGLLYAIDYTSTLRAISPLTGQDAWTLSYAPLSGPTARHNVLVHEGKAYFGVAGQFFVKVDLVTRQEVWRYTLPEAQAINTAALEQGKVYLSGRNGHVACLDAQTGAPLWSRNSGYPYSSAVTVSPDSVFLMIATGAVECLNRHDGSLRWKHQTYSYSSSNVAWCQGVLIIATDDRIVRAVDELTGKILWMKGVVGNFAMDGPIVVCGFVYVSGCAGEFYGFNAHTGEKVWTHAHGSHNSFVDMATADGQLFVVNADGRAFCFEPVLPVDPALCVCPVGPGQTPTPTAIPSPGPCGMAPDASLALWLRAGEGMGLDAQGRVQEWRDQSGHGRHAVAQAETARPLFQDGALLFDGSNDSLRVLNSTGLFSLTHDFTVVVKAWTDPSGGLSQDILSHSGAPGMGIRFGRTGGSQFAFTSCASLALTQAADANVAVMAVFVSSMGSTRVYKNGTLTHSAGPLSYYCSLDMHGSPFAVGSMGTQDGLFFKGKIREILVYNRALSNAERQSVEICELGVLPTATPSFTATRTRTPYPTPSLEEIQTQEAQLTAIATQYYWLAELSFSPTRTLTPHFQPTATPTPSPTASATHSLTPQPSLSSSPTRTATPTPTLSATFSPTPEPSAAPSPLPTTPPTAQPTSQPTKEPTRSRSCDLPLIDRVMITPNPSVAAADRMVSVKLGCGADCVLVEIFSLAQVKLYSWEVCDKHVERGQWVHLKYPHGDDLPNGTYHVRVRVAFEGRQESALTSFVVMK